MTGPVSTPRYSAEDFETASIRSTAPSYVSEVPSYHSQAYTAEPIPAYSPRSRVAGASSSRATAPPRQASHQSATESRQQQVGLPPIPAAPQTQLPSLYNFRTPTWSANNALAARQYHNVAARRISDGRYSGGAGVAASDSVNVPKRTPAATMAIQNDSSSTIRPLEDPYLVGEAAAARARQERILRESGEDILVREDKQWDWLLSHLKDMDERERSWTRFRRDMEMGQQRKKLFRRMGGRLL
jgi:hypothetical protein